MTLALAAGGPIPVDANGELMATTASTAAIDRVEVVPSFHVDAFLADDMAMLPDHPPIDQIPVMEMPNTDLFADVDALPGNPVFYDQLTGEMTEYDRPFWGNRGDGVAFGGGFAGADGMQGFEDLLGTRSFGTMSQISDASLENNPWRMNVKLVMEYTDAGHGNTIYRVCSGAI